MFFKAAMLAAAALPPLQLPAGFSAGLYADDVPGARSLAQSPAGVVYVGTRDEGRVYALRDRDGDGRADERHVIASGLNMPNGVAWHQGDLYVAEIDRILRFPGIDSRLADPPEPEVVTGRLPAERHHGWKFIAFGPDGMLYVPIGVPCNVCDREGYGLIFRMQPDGGGREVVARGVRNSVGFDWDPATGDLWFTDNGRDWMGRALAEAGLIPPGQAREYTDRLPPDELNHVTRAGQHFGFPYCHAGTIPDPQYGKGHDCADYRPPALRLGPHVAALGMRFYTGSRFPEEYRGDIILAEHGSWNRSEKIGYRLMRVHIEQGKAVAAEVFVSGWLRPDGSVAGRPVDVLVRPDGTLLVSDDYAGRIYRISYQP